MFNCAIFLIKIMVLPIFAQRWSGT